MSLILSGTDGLSDIDGTAATPAIRGTDANTGIFFGADIIGFAEGGAEVARFNADAQFVAAAGTASLPVITTTGDVNTGIFFPAADTIAFAEGGAEAMRIDSSGNVGIGTTTAVGRLTSEFNTAGTVTNTLTLNNNAAGTGSGVAINFYASNTSQPFTGRINSLDDGNYGSHTVFSNKVGGSSGAGSLTERMRIDSSGNLLVGTTSALSVGTRLNVENSGSSYVVASFKGAVNSNISVLRLERYASDGDAITFYYGSTQKGYISVLSTGTQYGTLSDYRLKENVQPMVGALAKVSALKPVTYDWKDIGKTGQGFIAHELKAIVPECVTGEKDELDDDGNPRYQGIDTSFLVATLTAAIQEQQALIQSLTARITALETP